MSSDTALRGWLGVSGLLSELPGRWRGHISLTHILLKGCPQACDSACYACLKAFRNKFHHPLLNRFRALELLESLNNSPEQYRTIEAVFEESSRGARTPSKTPEAQLLRLLQDHHFPGRRRLSQTADHVNECLDRTGLAARTQQSGCLP